MVGERLHLLLDLLRASIPFHRRAQEFVEACFQGSEVVCVAWTTAIPSPEWLFLTACAILDPAMDAADVRRWIASFEAAAEADRESLRTRAPDPAWSIRVSLEMIEAAAHAGRRADEPGLEAEAEAVRETWTRLRARLLR